jgi:hypothetical protein
MCVPLHFKQFIQHAAFFTYSQALLYAFDVPRIMASRAQMQQENAANEAKASEQQQGEAHVSVCEAAATVDILSLAAESSSANSEADATTVQSLAPPDHLALSVPDVPLPGSFGSGEFASEASSESSANLEPPPIDEHVQENAASNPPQSFDSHQLDSSLPFSQLSGDLEVCCRFNFFPASQRPLPSFRNALPMRRTIATRKLSRS